MEVSFVEFAEYLKISEENIQWRENADIFSCWLKETGEQYRKSSPLHTTADSTVETVDGFYSSIELHHTTY